ncbi:MAG: S24/S26 family peptidase [Eubacteriales bacterium]|nr:S24/S26 family peptidase [Eubacteriales bacterium]
MFDSNSYMNDMRDLIQSGRSISMIVSGNSMVPFLVNQRDFIYIEPLPGKIRKGDMCFFQRTDGTFIMHRVCKSSETFDQREQYWFVGDAQPVIEGPIDREQLFGIVTKVKRKGKWITKGSFWWDFFEKVWIRIIPCRMAILKIYSFFH